MKRIIKSPVYINPKRAEIRVYAGGMMKARVLGLKDELKIHSLTSTHWIHERIH